MALGGIGKFLQEVHAKWSREQLLAHGAALAYYTIFSLAPLLVLVIAVAGLVLGRAAVQGQVVGQIEGFVGTDAARLVEGMLAAVSSPRSGVVATAIGTGTMLLGASGVLGQLQATLNQIWGAARTAGGGLGSLARRRLASLALILAIGLLLLGSMLLTAALAAVQGRLARHLPALTAALPVLNLLLSLALSAALFALVFKVLPDVRVPWRDVWLGGVVTALLFAVGKTLIGLYLGRAGVTSIYGAASSLVLILLWVYYSAQILLVGAAVTEVFSRRYGSRRTAHAGGP
jgi:membrane protein